MKVNLCLILQLLPAYTLENMEITDKSAHIESFRVCADPDAATDSRYLYLCSKHGKILLLNGTDSICISGRADEDLINDLIALFGQLREWEQQLGSLALKRDLHGLIDFGTDILKNPIMLSDPSGNVLAMSTRYLEADYNSYWDCAREKGIVPLEVLSAPMYGVSGQLVSWGSSPQFLKTEDGSRLIGSFIQAGEETVAGLGLWEAGHTIQEGDLLLFSMLCSAIAQAMEPEGKNITGHDLGNLLAGVLDGERISPLLSSGIESRCPAPWSLVLVRTPFRNDIVYRKSLLYRLEQDFHPCIPFFHHEDLLVLVSAAGLQALLGRIAGEEDKLYYQALYSPFFGSLSDIKLRYDQCLYTLGQVGETPGFFNCETYGFHYLLQRLQTADDIRLLTHSVLKSLKEYDRSHSTEYYKTLFAYLRSEQSILGSAAVLHIHKNTMLYRLQKITELFSVNLKDPDERSFLLFSFYIEEGISGTAGART